MFHSRRPMAAAFVAGAAMVLTLAGGPAHASAAPAVAAGWVLHATYPGLPPCLAAGPGIAAGRQWQCTPSSRVPAAYDLQVWA